MLLIGIISTHFPFLCLTSQWDVKQHIPINQSWTTWTKGFVICYKTLIKGFVICYKTLTGLLFVIRHTKGLKCYKTSTKGFEIGSLSIYRLDIISFICKSVSGQQYELFLKLTHKSSLLDTIWKGWYSEYNTYKQWIILFQKMSSHNWITRVRALWCFIHTIAVMRIQMKGIFNSVWYTTDIKLSTKGCNVLW